MSALPGKRCRLCRAPARYGRACDDCRRRCNFATPTPRRPRPAPRLPADAVSTATFRTALARSTDPPEVIADLLGWHPSELREALARSWVTPAKALALCAALHVAPVEVGM